MLGGAVMKKGWIIFGCIAVALAIVAGCWYVPLLRVGYFELYLEYDQIINDPQFSPESYKIEYPPQEPVDTAAQARALAQKVWLQIYEDKTIFSDRPYQVFYDMSDHVWLVTGTLPLEGWIGITGGTPCLLVKAETGEILAIWHGK